MYKEIDFNTWDRREHYQHFARLKFPHYNVAAQINVSRLLEYKREHGLSFYLSLIYLVTKSLNQIENFNYRMKDGRVVMYDIIHTNFTHKKPEEGLFRFHTAPFQGTLLEYVADTSAAIIQQDTLFGGLGDIPNVAYCSCIPTLDATAMSNPGMENPEDAIPRINWGKYVERDGRWMLNVTLTPNHRFIDGYHVGLFFQILQEEINRL
ncbi:MAG: hypothetical protein J5548_05560 [Prevotella sp.]|nr:hypothetical protein [Prevotella sp.]